MQHIGFVEPDIGVFFCHEHVPPELRVLEVYRGDGETDVVPSCDVCGTIIPENVTQYGLEQILNEVEDFKRLRIGDEQRVQELIEHYGDELDTLVDSFYKEAS